MCEWAHLVSGTECHSKRDQNGELIINAEVQGRRYCPQTKDLWSISYVWFCSSTYKTRLSLCNYNSWIISCNVLLGRGSHLWNINLCTYYANKIPQSNWKYRSMTCYILKKNQLSWKSTLQHKPNICLKKYKELSLGG